MPVLPSPSPCRLWRCLLVRKSQTFPGLPSLIDLTQHACNEAGAAKPEVGYQPQLEVGQQAERTTKEYTHRGHALLHRLFWPGAPFAPC